MSDEIRAVDCPSCGAPLTLTDEGQRTFECEFCGATLEDQRTRKQVVRGQRPTIVIRSAGISSPPLVISLEPAKSAKRAVSLIGCAIVALILLIAAVAVVGSGLLASGEKDLIVPAPFDTVRVYSFGPTRLLPAGADREAGPDVVGVTRNSDDTERLVYVDFEPGATLRWQSEPLGEGAAYVFNPVVADQSSVYLAYETTLAAYDRQDGTNAWQALLSDEIANICQDCLQVFDDHLVALTADGVLHGIDAATGEPIWSVRLSATPRQLMNLGGRPAVLDENDDRVGINVYEPAAGTLLQRIEPECPNEVFADRPQTPRIYDSVLVAGDGGSFFVAMGDYRPGCILKWDASALTLIWQATMPADTVRSLDREPYLLTDRALTISDGHKLFEVNLSDGSGRELFSDEDHDLAPLAAGDGMLLVLAERTRGSRQYALWGIDSATGTKRWGFTPAAEEMDDGTSDVAYSGGLWSVAVTAGQVLVLEAFSDPNTVNFTTLNLADGAQSGQSAYAFGDDGSSYWIQVLGWNSGRVTLVLDGRLRTLDYTTGQEIGVWP